MSSSATGVGMTICFLGAILLILTQKSSQKFGDVLGIFYVHNNNLLILKQKYKKYSKTHKIVRLFNIKPNNYYSNNSRYSIFLLRSMEGTIFPFHLLKSI